jgi:hypothetical protein
MRRSLSCRIGGKWSAIPGSLATQLTRFHQSPLRWIGLSSAVGIGQSCVGPKRVRHSNPSRESPAHQREFSDRLFGILADHWDRLGWGNVVVGTPLFLPRRAIEVFHDDLLSPRQSVAPAHDLAEYHDADGEHKAKLIRCIAWTRGANECWQSSRDIWTQLTICLAGLREFGL